MLLDQDPLIRSALIEMGVNPTPKAEVPIVEKVTASSPFTTYVPNSTSNRSFDGEKYFGGLPAARWVDLNYYELRTRSSELFDTNIYGRGIVRRLVRSVISTGLLLESNPIGRHLGLDDDQEAEWSDETETRFLLWTSTKEVCDYKAMRTFEEIQKHVYREAIVGGDVLVVLRYPNDGSGLPLVEIISGDRVTTPWKKTWREGHRVEHGVELDKRGRHVAYWVLDAKNEHKRIAVRGEKSKRQLAFLVYGVDRREGRVRGEPLLSIVLQSIAEIDRYRDSEQRAATVNSLLAMFIARDRDGIPTMPASNGAVRKDTIAVETTTDSREFDMAGHIPGVIFEALGAGEMPHSFNTSRPNVNYATFEAAIVHAIAWALEIPPEILQLAFNANYTASKAAMGEFREFVVGERKYFANQFCTIIYRNWLLSEVALGKITAPGYVEAWMRNEWDILAAWNMASWGGPVKPSIELLKDVKAYTEAVKAGACTMDRMCKDLFGMRYRTVVKQLGRELPLLVESRQALAEEALAEAEARSGFSDQGGNEGGKTDDTSDKAEAIADAVIGELRELMDVKAAA